MADSINTCEDKEKAVINEIQQFITSGIEKGQTMAEVMRRLEYLLFVAWVEWQPPIAKKQAKA